MEILSLRMGLPPVDPTDEDAYAQRISDLEFLQKWEINNMAAAIVRALSGK